MYFNKHYNPCRNPQTTDKKWGSRDRLRLHELKEQGLITFEKLSLKDSHELLNNIEILGM